MDMAKQSTKRKSVREVFSEDEISLIDLVTLFTDRKKILFVTTAFFFLVAILIAATSPIEYEAEAQVLSESGEGSQTTSLGGLAGLAGLAGIDLSRVSNGAGLSPDMYPAIAASEPFLLDLMQERFYFQEKGREMSIYEYFNEERPGHIFSKTFGFVAGVPNRFFALFEKKREWMAPSLIQSGDSATTVKVAPSNILNITKNEEYVMKELESRIVIESVGKIITLKVKMPEPYISAQLNNIVRDKIIDYVVAYKTDKQRQNLEFIEERTREAEENFKRAQLRLATFRDANQGMVTQTARTKEEQLQAEFNLAFSIYNKLAQELEQTKIQLKKETPLFTDFQPVSVPLKAAEPNVPKIIVLYFALAVVIGGIAILASIVRAYLKDPERQVAESRVDPEPVESRNRGK